MSNDTAVEMFVGGLVLDPNNQVPVVVLKDESGKITLPIWIGPAEATSIASVIKQISLGRPLTHDLMSDIFGQLGVQVQRVMITELKDSTYYAELVISLGDKAMIFDSRPSDAIALALRASAPIYVAQQVLDQAKVAFSGGAPVPGSEPPGTEGEGGSSDLPPEGTPIQGKDFSAIDKDKWIEILNNLDPEDFKYKM